VVPTQQGDNLPRIPQFKRNSSHIYLEPPTESGSKKEKQISKPFSMTSLQSVVTDPIFIGALVLTAVSIFAVGKFFSGRSAGGQKNGQGKGKEGAQTCAEQAYSYHLCSPPFFFPSQSPLPEREFSRQLSSKNLL